MRIRSLLPVSAAVAALALPASGTPSQTSPSRADQSTGPYRGVGIGVLDRFRHIESSFTSNSSDYYRGRFTYSFSIDGSGNVSGTGSGVYQAARWHLEGTNDGRQFSCDVPMRTQPYQVRITGAATADTITVRFALEGSRERNDDHPCGAGFTGYATDSDRLGDSLRLVQPAEGIRISRANPRIAPLVRLELIGDDSDRRVNLHEWAFTIAGPDSPPPPPPPTPGGPGSPPIELVGTVGPGNKISLTQGGRRVRILPARAYRILVRDRSRAHNFRLRGPGVNRATGVLQRGNVTWNVTLRRGTYAYLSDPQARRLRGSVLVG